MTMPHRLLIRLILGALSALPLAAAAAPAVPVDTNTPDVVKTYQIVNKASGFAVMPEWAGTRPGARGLHHWPQDDPGVQSPEAFDWYFVPVPAKPRTYWIVNKTSGYGLMPEFAGTRKDKRGMHHWPLDDQGVQDVNGTQWLVEELGDGHVHIVNAVSHLALMPEFAGTRPDKRGMHHWPLDDRGVQSQDGFKWRLNEVGSKTLPPLPQPTFVDVKPSLSQHGVPHQPVEVGVVGIYWIPCATVADPGKSIEWKLNNSPYYQVERTARWITDSTTAFYNASDVPVTKTWTRTVGWTKAQQKKFEMTVGFSISGGSKLLGASFQSTFSMTTGASSTVTRNEAMEDGTRVTVPPNTTMALWQRVDTLRVKRMDGTIVSGDKWDVPGTLTSMTQFPTKGAPAAPAGDRGQAEDDGHGDGDAHEDDDDGGDDDGDDDGDDGQYDED